MRTFSSYKTPIIPAGSAITQSITGSEFLVVDCTAPFYVAINGGERILMKRGRRFTTGEDEMFTNLTFFNETTANLTVEYYAGTMGVRDDSQVFVELQPTKIVGNGGANGTAYLDGDGLLALPAATFIALTGVTAAGERRKQVIITNLDGGASLRVRKTAGSARSIATIFPTSAWTLETDAPLALHNFNGAPVSCQILETFYTEIYDSVGD